MIDKFVHSMADAMAGIADGSTVLLGGFGDVGIPTPLLDGLIAQGARDLTIVAVAGGRDGSAIEQLLSLGRVRRLICSFVRPASLSGRLFQRGELEVEIIPQGTMAERMRAAGAGITGFYTPTGADTLLAEGRETREIGGRLCLLEYPLPGDVALIEAWSADRWGNLTYRDSARNFNPVMAMAAKLTIAMTRQCRGTGRAHPGDDRDAGHLRRSRAARAALRGLQWRTANFPPLDRNGMAAWCARDIPEGWLVNLGIGIPTLVADFVPADREVIFHAENGVIGVGPAPAPDAVNPFLINASTTHVTLRTGGILCAPCRQLRHRARRASGSVRAGRVRGGGERRHRQLGALGGRAGEAGRRRDGPRDRRATALGGDGAQHQGWRATHPPALHLSADREGRGEARLYQPGGAGRDTGRLRRCAT